jgi:hypothetical protein
MRRIIELEPFFEPDEARHDGVPDASYVVGFRQVDGARAGIEITLPAEIVERTVLTGARLSVSLSPEGRLMLDGESLDHEVLEAASAAGGIRAQTLESLVAGCLRLDLLGGEDDPIGDLTALRGQLMRALAQLDATVEQLRTQRAR